jgi:hypothetical protein
MRWLLLMLLTGLLAGCSGGYYDEGRPSVYDPYGGQWERCWVHRRPAWCRVEDWEK